MKLSNIFISTGLSIGIVAIATLTNWTFNDFINEADLKFAFLEGTVAGTLLTLGCHIRQRASQIAELGIIRRRRRNFFLRF